MLLDSLLMKFMRKAGLLGVLSSFTLGALAIAFLLLKGISKFRAFLSKVDSGAILSKIFRSCCNSSFSFKPLLELGSSEKRRALLPETKISFFREGIFLYFFCGSPLEGRLWLIVC